MNTQKSDKYIIGIDASSIKGGGGKNHLIELLSSTIPSENNIKKIVVWSNKDVLDQIKDFDWLKKYHLIQLIQIYLNALSGNYFYYLKLLKRKK